MQSPIDKLKDKVLGDKIGKKGTQLTALIQMAREFGCLGEIVGRDFEVLNKKGECICTIRQKPLCISQIQTLFHEFRVIKEIDAEIEAAKFGSKKGKRGLK